MLALPSLSSSLLSRCPQPDCTCCRQAMLTMHLLGSRCACWAGCLHPDHQGVFDSPAAYMAWYGKHGTLRGTRAPVAALLLYRKHVITQQPYIDALVRCLEGQGVLPLPIFINGVEAHTIVRSQRSLASCRIMCGDPAVWLQLLHTRSSHTLTRSCAAWRARACCPCPSSSTASRRTPSCALSTGVDGLTLWGDQAA